MLMVTGTARLTRVLSIGPAVRSMRELLRFVVIFVFGNLFEIHVGGCFCYTKNRVVRNSHKLLLTFLKSVWICANLGLISLEDESTIAVKPRRF